MSVYPSDHHEETDQPFPDPGYHLLTHMVVVVFRQHNVPHLKFAPGASFLMGSKAHLQVGAALKAGTLIANGTEADSIIFTSLTNTSNWGPGSTGASQIGMRFSDNASPASSLTYCKLNRANNAVVVNNTRITIAHCPYLQLRAYRNSYFR